ncbi:MAG TPA: carbohydrate ABC transporter permease, partial [Clostridia bacterium]|nr:carbohydrate ABC transporter permease [Clostridia bacterium]
MLKRMTFGDRIFNAVNVLLMVTVMILVLYPLYFIFIASFTDPVIVNSGKVLLYPEKLFWGGYGRIFQYKPLWTGYMNSFLYMFVGTSINLLVTIPAAYAFSRKDLYLRNPLLSLFTFTMFFGGGLIPLYLLILNLKILNTIWAMVLPGALSVWNMIICRTFFQTNLPEELLESAVLDGCTDFQYFFRIVLPLSKVIVAVMVLFYAVGHWNSYFNALIFLNDSSKYPLQIVLRNLLVINQINNEVISDPMGIAQRARLAEQLKYGVIVVSSL